MTDIPSSGVAANELLDRCGVCNAGGNVRAPARLEFLEICAAVGGLATTMGLSSRYKWKTFEAEACWRLSGAVFHGSYDQLNEIASFEEGQPQYVPYKTV